MNPPQDNNQPCLKCQGDVTIGDKFCRHCGEKDPANGFTWDWKSSPPWGKVNAILQEYGCEIEEIETKTDQHAARVVAWPKF